MSDNYSCSVHRTLFNEDDHRPYVLHCGHSICMEVIRTLRTGHRAQAFSVNCPICREDNNYLDENNIKRNFHFGAYGALENSLRTKREIFS